VTFRLLLFALTALALRAQGGEQVLLVVNRSAPVSREIADYYRPRRSIPERNICFLDTTAEEEISWEVYERQIEKPVASCLREKQLQEKILYIVLTMGVPLKVEGPGAARPPPRAGGF
jgi:uncharacterized protein (TIGR03790 family)